MSMAISIGKIIPNAQTSGKVKEAKIHRSPRRRTETEPETGVMEQQMREGMKNLDTAVLLALIDVMARYSYWDDAVDARSVIMYLPP